MNTSAFFNMSYGVYIASSINGDKINAHIVNAVIQSTSSPATFCLCSNKDNLTCQYILNSSVFAISVLSSEADMKFIGQFGFKSGRDIDKFDGVKYRLGKTGCPIVLDHTVAYVECKVINKIDLGSHILFVGEVVDADNIADLPVLTYSDYHKVKKGLSPKNAPTFVEKQEIETKEVKSMKKYVKKLV